MEQSGKIFLKWVYTPADFFEVKITDLLPDYEHIIENGEITVSMDLDEYQRNPNIQDQLHEFFFSYFKGANLTIQKPFTLKQAGGQIIYPDGRKGYILQAEAAIFMTSFGSVDFCVIDSGGKIKIDTKQARLNRTRRYGVLAVKYRRLDPVVESLLSSFEKSRNNPKTELVHLYEIRDSLSTRFDGKKNAIQKLGISEDNWVTLGRLADNEPFNQGRHSGKHIGALRDATERELKEARDIAVEIVFAYLEYLERNASNTQ